MLAISFRKACFSLSPQCPCHRDAQRQRRRTVFFSSDANWGLRLHPNCGELPGRKESPATHSGHTGPGGHPAIHRPNGALAAFRDANCRPFGSESRFQCHHFLLRSQLTGDSHKAIRAGGVARPPTIKNNKAKHNPHS